MVLINGVKYACERCIRGHRVTTCTHTDQPLTMIKPKGRPASQCLHCREQRKLKHSHVSCTCGKKGKSPGTHLASCLCHKNSHCTCSTNNKKTVNERKKKSSVKVNQALDGTITPNNGSDSNSNLDNNYVLEDVIVPFESGNGLFDLFSPNPDSSSTNLNGLNNLSPSSSTFTTNDEKSKLLSNNNPVHDNELNNDSNETYSNPPKQSNGETDIDMVENMFPLFPLVGTCSFDDSASLPMLGIPTSPRNNQPHYPEDSRKPAAPQPRAMRSSSDISSHHQTSTRPKRPESVLSITSSSSTASRPNFHDNSSILSFNPSMNQNGSSAYPPIESESSDDQALQKFASQKTELQLISQQDNYDLRLVSYEDFMKNLSNAADIGSPNSITPQSSIPSRQPLQNGYQKQKNHKAHQDIEAPESIPDVEPYIDYPNPMTSDWTTKFD